MSDVAVGETFDTCDCSNFLLEVETHAREMSDQYLAQGDGLDASLISLLAFRLLESDLNEKAQIYFDIVTTTHLDSKFPLPDEGEAVKNYPWLGEAAARNFLREAFLTLADKDCGLTDTWVFFKHGAALATFWAHWYKFAHRNIQGFSYADLEIKKLKGILSSSEGGDERARKQQPKITSERRDWKERADKISAPSKAAKAKIIEKDLKKAEPLCKTTWQTIQRYI